MAISDNSVDMETMIHGAVHSTLYRTFPIWIETGMAYCIENYSMGSIDYMAGEFESEWRQFRMDSRLYLRFRKTGTYLDRRIDEARGFLSLNALYRVKGIEAISSMVRTLRIQHYSDQDLVRA